MPKKEKRGMSGRQKKLYTELQKLQKRANQRIARLEAKFGKGSWGIKNLSDKLDTEILNAWSNSR